MWTPGKEIPLPPQGQRGPLCGRGKVLADDVYNTKQFKQHVDKCEGPKKKKKLTKKVKLAESDGTPSILHWTVRPSKTVGINKPTFAPCPDMHSSVLHLSAAASHLSSAASHLSAA